MKLNPVEWSDAQKLLLQLVDALSPFVEKPSKPYFSPSIRLYIPPKTDENHSLQERNPVRILLTLQKQVHDWAGSEQGEGTVSNLGLQTEKNTTHVQSSSAPIAKQAKSLITQVQHAIGNLISSTNIKNPKEEPLREAMKRLKPHLDQMIQAVAEDGEELLQSPVSRSFTTPSERESKLKPTLKKEAALPRIAQEILKNPDEKILQEPVKTPAAKTAEKREIRNFQKPEEAPQKEELPAASHEKKSSLVQETVSFLPPSKPAPIVQGGLSIQTNDHEQVVSKPVEKPSTPLVPFVPEARSLTPARKKKKKKGFWRRSEPDDDRKDS